MIGSVYNSSTCQTVGRISHKGIVYYAAQMEASASASDNNFVRNGAIASSGQQRLRKNPEKSANDNPIRFEQRIYSRIHGITKL
jgi:hypothetical protein